MTAAPPRPRATAVDPESLKALLAELERTAEAIRDGMAGLAPALSNERAGGDGDDPPTGSSGPPPGIDAAPDAGDGPEGAPAAPSPAEALQRLLEAAPPELRERIAAAATLGLSATRDLADWLLAQVAPGPARPVPEELPIVRASRPIIRPVTAPATWILTASVDNHLVTEARGFSVIGIKERHRRRALQMAPGDVVVLYLTKVMAFAGAVRITGDLHEDRAPIWPGQPEAPDSYPWRLPTEPVLVLPRSAWLPAAALKDDLEHVRKWPSDHWTLAFQGQLRTVSAEDSALLLDRLHAAAPQPA